MIVSDYYNLVNQKFIDICQFSINCLSIWYRIFTNRHCNRQCDCILLFRVISWDGSLNFWIICLIPFCKCGSRHDWYWKYANYQNRCNCNLRWPIHGLWLFVLYKKWSYNLFLVQTRIHSTTNSSSHSVQFHMVLFFIIFLCSHIFHP